MFYQQTTYSANSERKSCVTHLAGGSGFIWYPLRPHDFSGHEVYHPFRFPLHSPVCILPGTSLIKEKWGEVSTKVTSACSWNSRPWQSSKQETNKKDEQQRESNLASCWCCSTTETQGHRRVGIVNDPKGRTHIPWLPCLSWRICWIWWGTRLCFSLMPTRPLKAPATACVRELREETSLVASNPQLIGVYGDPGRGTTVFPN